MGYGRRDKPERKSGRAGFVKARLEELRRRLETSTDDCKKSHRGRDFFGCLGIKFEQ